MSKSLSSEYSSVSDSKKAVALSSARLIEAISSVMADAKFRCIVRLFLGTGFIKANSCIVGITHASSSGERRKAVPVLFPALLPVMLLLCECAGALDSTSIASAVFLAWAMLPNISTGPWHSIPVPLLKSFVARPICPLLAATRFPSVPRKGADETLRSSPLLVPGGCSGMGLRPSLGFIEVSLFTVECCESSTCLCSTCSP
mmetsp:Transcript_17208/g.49344  ORF Transcript_17208/g.49344 Transcript_17208/m.49344 type:complete len:202 (+) Transcript_17208:340-945(+)